MHPKNFLTPALVAVLCFLKSEPGVFAQEISASERQILQPSVPLFFSASPFLFSVTWMPDGSLAVSPDCISQADPSRFSQVQLPPSVRTSREEGRFLGETELTDGTWMPIFSAPTLFSNDEPETSEDPTPSKKAVKDEVKALRNLNMIRSAALVSTNILSTARSGEPMMPDGPTNALADRLILNVDAINGDDRWDGRALKKSSIIGGKVRGPGKNLKTILAAAMDSSNEEVEIILAPGTYRWSGIPEHKKTLLITPMDGVVIDFE